MFNLYRDLAPYLRPHRRQYLVGALAVVMVMVFTVLLPLILARAVDLLATGEATPAALLLNALFLVGSALLAALFNLLQRRQIVVASRQVEGELRDALYAHLITLDRAFYERSRVGDLMNRLAGDLLVVREVLGPGLNMGSRVTLVALGALGAMIVIDWRLGLLVAGTVPLAALAASRLKTLVAERFERVQEKLSEIAAEAQETFAGVRVVKGYALEGRRYGAFAALNDALLRLNLKLACVEAPTTALMGLFMALTNLAVLVYGGRLVVFDQGLSVGSYVAFATYLTMLSAPVVALGRLVTIYQRGAVSWLRLKSLLDARPTVEDGGRTMAVPTRGELEFRNVTLRLGGRAVLSSINLRVPAGSSLGLTGRTGAGKSLLAALLTRQFDPSAGSVRLDGCDLRDLPLAALRERVGLVSQEPFLFSGTLAENIGFGLPNSPGLPGFPASGAVRIAWAAYLADLQRDVEGFPRGFEALLGEQGVTLSGGQRQRTAIARTLACQPTVLVFDDALSAVDAETEGRILARLREVTAGQTVLLISHRVSVLEQADKVVVLEGGRIIEAGMPAELLVNGGRYAALARRQRLTEGDED